MGGPTLCEVRMMRPGRVCGEWRLIPYGSAESEIVSKSRPGPEWIALDIAFDTDEPWPDGYESE